MAGCGTIEVSGLHGSYAAYLGATSLVAPINGLPRETTDRGAPELHDMKLCRHCAAEFGSPEYVGSPDWVGVEILGLVPIGSFLPR